MSSARQRRKAAFVPRESATHSGGARPRAAAPTARTGQVMATRFVAASVVGAVTARCTCVIRSGRVGGVRSACVCAARSRRRRSIVLPETLLQQSRLVRRLLLHTLCARVRARLRQLRADRSQLFRRGGATPLQLFNFCAGEASLSPCSPKCEASSCMSANGTRAGKTTPRVARLQIKCLNELEQRCAAAALPAQNHQGCSHRSGRTKRDAARSHA